MLNDIVYFLFFPLVYKLYQGKHFYLFSVLNQHLLINKLTESPISLCKVIVLKET